MTYGMMLRQWAFCDEGTVKKRTFDFMLDTVQTLPWEQQLILIKRY